MLSNSGVLSKKKVEEVAIKVIRSYKDSVESDMEDGLTKSEAVDEALNGKKLMVQRVQDLATIEVAKQVKRHYRGERYEWLPSSANEPDPLHQLNYGKRFWIGKGEMPGDRYGCQCGMRILIEEDVLFIGDEAA